MSLFPNAKNGAGFFQARPMTSPSAAPIGIKMPGLFGAHSPQGNFGNVANFSAHGIVQNTVASPNFRTIFKKEK